MATLFGFELRRAQKEPVTASFAPVQLDDGAHNVSTGGMYGTYVDLEGATRTEAEMVTPVSYTHLTLPTKRIV